MKNSNSVKQLKNQMREYLNLHPDNSDLSFQDYFVTSTNNNEHVGKTFCLNFFDKISEIADLNFVEDLKGSSAQRAIESLNYTYYGDIDKWKPPTGNIDKINNLYDKVKTSKTSKTPKTPNFHNKYITDWLDSNDILESFNARQVAKDAFHYALTLIGKNQEPNIIFGILTNGEIFVEVNGIQHTPDDGFYKLATIESSKLAHQVRDLTIELQSIKEFLKEAKAELIAVNIALGNCAKAEINTIKELSETKIKNIRLFKSNRKLCGINHKRKNKIKTLNEEIKEFETKYLTVKRKHDDLNESLFQKKDTIYEVSY